MTQLFTSGGQSIGASASASVLPMNTQDWSPLGWACWISLQSKGLSRVFSNTTVQKHQFFGAQPSLWSDSHLTTGKIIALPIQTFVSKVMSLLFNMLSGFVIAFLPRSKCLLILQLQSPSAVILEPKKIKSVTFPYLFTVKWWYQLPRSSFFECWVLSQIFHFSLSPSSKSCLVPLCFLPLEWYHLHIWSCWYFSQQSWFQHVIHPAWHFINKQ